MADDKPKNPEKPVSEVSETRRWCPRLKCWLYPTFDKDGNRIWVTIPR